MDFRVGLRSRSAGRWWRDVELRNTVGAVAVFTAYTAIGVVMLVLARRVHGVARFALTAVGAIGVGLGVLFVGAAMAIFLVWGPISGMARTTPRPAEWVGWFVAAAGLGILLGAGVYDAGLAALIDGPALLAFSVVFVQTKGFPRRYANRRLIVFAAIAAVVSLLVGLTVFH